MSPASDKTAPSTNGSREGSGARIPDAVSENLSEYESNLASHVNLVRSLASRLDKDPVSDDKTDLVSAVVNSAQRLMEQFAAIKREINIVSMDTRDDEEDDDYASAVEERNDEDGEELPSKQQRRKAKATGARRKPILNGGTSTDQGSSSQKLWPGEKRGRKDQDMDGVEYSSDSKTSQKRQRTRRRIPGADENVEDYIPVALQKDDISEEVEQRLRLREERRKKWNSALERKRKRSEERNHDTENDIETEKEVQLLSKKQRARKSNGGNS